MLVGCQQATSGNSCCLGLPRPLGSLRSITVPDPSRRREMAESWMARWDGWSLSSLSLIFSICSSVFLSGLSLNWQKSWYCTYFKKILGSNSGFATGSQIKSYICIKCLSVQSLANPQFNLILRLFIQLHIDKNLFWRLLCSQLQISNLNVCW